MLRLAPVVSLVMVVLAAPAQAQEPTPVESLVAGVIGGQVVAADSGAPLRGAQVRLREQRGADTRLVLTDERGRFEARNLFAGTWIITASKNGFVTVRYGQRRSSDEGTPVNVTARQRAEVLIALPRAGAIMGRVLDEFGEPLLGARIQALRARVVRGARQLVPVGMSDTTDDTGSFRVFGLTPGTYYVTAMLRASAPDTDLVQNTLGATTYYPGTGDVGEAQPIVLRAGEEMNVAFQTAPVRSVRVSGIVLGANGQPTPNVPVRLMRVDGTEIGTTVGNFGQSGPDGSFMIINVSPGQYALNASRAMPIPTVANRDTLAFVQLEEGSLPLTVGVEDIAGVTLSMSVGVTVNGSIVAEPGSTLPSPLRVEVTALSAAGFGRNPAIIQVNRAAGQPTTFQMPGMRGPILLGVNLPDGLMLSAIEANGVDVTDKPVEFRGNAPEVRIVLSRRVTEVSGVVTSARAPVPNVTVLVFPEDREKWAFPSRYVAFADTNDQGRFVIPRLPARERYLAAVVTSLEDGDQFDQDLLDRLRPGATLFTLGEGERRTLNLALER